MVYTQFFCQSRPFSDENKNWLKLADAGVRDDDDDDDNDDDLVS